MDIKINKYLFICIITAKFAVITNQEVVIMLIEFSVTNFGSIKDEQTFSMVASKNKELIDTNTFDAPLKDGSNIKLLPAAAIYGPNAAGKTNLLFALLMMSMIVKGSVLEKSRGEPLNVTPFKLHPDSRNAPSKFEMIFIAEGIRYQYGFSATEKRIMEEWLYTYPEGRRQRWFTRVWDNDEYQWSLGASLTGSKTIWQKATRENALFLSTAIQLNSRQLQPVYDWFRNILCLAISDSWHNNFSARFCEDKDKKRILDFLKKADLNIDDVLVRKENFKQPLMATNPHPDLSKDVKQTLLNAAEKQTIDRITMVHKGTDGKPVTFDIKDESDGTQKMFFLAGPWIDILEKGHVLCIDELHDNLHPKLVEYLVRLFNNQKTNPKNAQLVFTTHETSILNQEILRRDQIWFCEKDKTQATQVFPLTDFHPRKGRENLEATYLSGVYGALPYVPEMQI